MKALFAIIGMVAALVACSPVTLDDSRDVETAKGILADLQAGNYDAIESRVTPSLPRGTVHAGLVQMRTLLPPQPPETIQRVGYHVFEATSPGHHVRRVNLTLQLAFPGQWLVSHYQWSSDGDGPMVIEAFNIQPLPAPLETLNAFTLTGKGAGHYIFLAATLAAPAISLVALFLCIRSPLPRRRKVLWAVGILVGFGRLSLDWTSGAIMVSPLWFQLLSAGYTYASDFAPVIISVSVPVFALLFLVKRHRRNLTPSGQGVA